MCLDGCDWIGVLRLVCLDRCVQIDVFRLMCLVCGV